MGEDSGQVWRGFKSVGRYWGNVVYFVEWIRGNTQFDFDSGAEIWIGKVIHLICWICEEMLKILRLHIISLVEMASFRVAKNWGM